MMKHYSLTAAAAFVGLANSQATSTVSSAPAGSPTADLGYARYVGYNNATAGISYFRGIPFAQPPLGDLRWQKPRSIESGNDFDGQLFNATEIAPGCYQSQPESIYMVPNSNYVSRTRVASTHDDVLTVMIACASVRELPYPRCT